MAEAPSAFTEKSSHECLNLKDGFDANYVTGQGPLLVEEYLKVDVRTLYLSLNIKADSDGLTPFDHAQFHSIVAVQKHAL